MMAVNANNLACIACNRIKKSHHSGFTLIELLITLAILGAMASLVIPSTQLVRQRNNEQELRLALRAIRLAIDTYYQACSKGQIPKNLSTSCYPQNLNILVDGTTNQLDSKHSKIYFLRRIPRDPMNSNSNLTNEETWGKRSYTSEADDPKEGDDVYDIFSTSTKISLNGTPYNKW